MKITNLLEATIASMPEPGQVSFRSGRSETSLEEMTAGGSVSGSIASVAKPMGKTIKRESGITQGIKKKMVDEGELSENDLILVPGQMSKRSKGFVSKDRNEMERIEMAKSDVVQSVKSATAIFSILKNSDDEIEGWVQEKLAKAEDYLDTVREYLEGKTMPAEGQSASARMQKALQREKEKREYSERYAEKHFPIGKKPEPIKEPSKEVKEDDKAVDDFLARGGKIQHGKPQKGPKKPGLSYASKHIGGSGDKMKMSRTGYGTKPAGNKPVVTAEATEGPHDWMDQMKSMAHKIAPQDKLKQAQAERQTQQQAEQQQRLQQDIENLPDLMSQYRDMKSEYESIGGSNWQYADNEQNLSDEERKARGMETSMRQLANRIHAAKKASEGLAESKPDFGKMFDKKIGKHNKAVVKTKKEIGTRVADIGAGGKEYNVKTDKEWDKQQGVAEGAKVDRMVKHVKSSEKKLGHSDKEAENIAWATANKRGMLDNKNKKVEEESKGLWANIHAKRERIKQGSGEKMRKPGSTGAPTADALRKSAK